MLCYQCGSDVPEKAPACANCGADLNSATRALRIPKGPLGPEPAEASAAPALPGIPFALGDTLDGARFRLSRVLGAGPFGAVFRARDKTLGHDVALKLFQPDSCATSNDRARFERAVEQTRHQLHPHLVRLRDSGFARGCAFVVMPCLEGLNLRRVMELRPPGRRAFTTVEVEPLARQLVNAVQLLHRSGVHGDLKPENIIIERQRLQVTDAFLHAALRLDVRLNPYAANVYAAPEAQADPDKATRRSDVYALAAILSELLTGVPFEPSHGASLPRTHNPSLPEALDWIFERALAPRPADRYAHLEGFSEDLFEVFDTEGGLLQPGEQGHPGGAPAPMGRVGPYPAIRGDAARQSDVRLVGVDLGAGVDFGAHALGAPVDPGQAPQLRLPNETAPLASVSAAAAAMDVTDAVADAAPSAFGAAFSSVPATEADPTEAGDGERTLVDPAPSMLRHALSAQAAPEPEAPAPEPEKGSLVIGPPPPAASKKRKRKRRVDPERARIAPAISGEYTPKDDPGEPKPKKRKRPRAPLADAISGEAKPSPLSDPDEGAEQDSIQLQADASKADDQTTSLLPQLKPEDDPRKAASDDDDDDGEVTARKSAPKPPKTKRAKKPSADVPDIFETPSSSSAKRPRKGRETDLVAETFTPARHDPRRTQRVNTMPRNLQDSGGDSNRNGLVFGMIALVLVLGLAFLVAAIYSKSPDNARKPTVKTVPNFGQK